MQKELANIDKDELFSLSLVRRYFAGAITPFEQKLKVAAFQN